MPSLYKTPLLACALSLLTIGCPGEEPIPDGGAPAARTQPLFDLAADPMDFGSIPFPDDLYLGDDGRIDLGALPSEGSAFEGFSESMRVGLRDLDGFGANSPIFFYFPPGSIDAASLPESPAASVREDSSVFVIDADSGSPEAFSRVPVTLHWNADLGQLAIRPYEGHPLVPGRRYAAVVTTAVLDDGGEPIGPNDRFLSIRDAATVPADPIEAEAYEHYTPVLSSLSSNGTPREQVAALAAFTVQTVAADMADARAHVWARDPEVVRLDDSFSAGDPLDNLLGIPSEEQPGLDVPGGVAHRRIGWLAHGHFDSPWFISDAAGVHGRFKRDAAGELISTRSEQVPFTITLPAGAVENVPVVIFQHGLGSERSTMLSIADLLAGSGYAVLAIDIPFHGSRSTLGGEDVRHNYGGGDGPDGFGERTGTEIYLDYLGVVDVAGELEAFHPNYPREAIRQSAVDLLSLTRVVREGDWSELRALPGLETLSFSNEPVSFVGVSLGGIVGTVFVASEPEIGAAVMNVTGGDLTALVERSPAFSGLFLPILLPRIGIDPGSVDPTVYPAVFYPEVALVQTLLDRGDSMAFAPLMANEERHLLFQMAEHDETVPNSATEALARASGVPIVDAEPAHTDLAMESAPLSLNVEVEGTRLTRGLYRYAPANHGLLTRRGDEATFAHPPEPPFVEQPAVVIANPIDDAQAQLLHFLDSWRSGNAEIAAPAP